MRATWKMIEIPARWPESVRQEMPCTMADRQEFLDGFDLHSRALVYEEIRGTPA